MLGSSRVYNTPTCPAPGWVPPRMPGPAPTAVSVADLRVHEGFEAVAGKFAFAFRVEPHQVGNHALEGTRRFAHLAGPPEGKLDFSFAGAAQQHSFEVLRQVLVGGVHALLI